MEIVDYAGQGMVISRINSSGEIEHIKDYKIEKRVELIVTRNVVKLQQAHDAWLRQAEIERKKCDARRVKNSRWRMHYKKANECLQVAHSYQVVIQRIQEENGV